MSPYPQEYAGPACCNKMDLSHVYQLTILVSAQDLGFGIPMKLQGAAAAPAIVNDMIYPWLGSMA